MILRGMLRKVLPVQIKRLYYRRLPKSSGHTTLTWVLCHLTPPPKVILDVGANIGETTRTFLRFFPGALVYAVEPRSRTFQQLQANCSGVIDRVRPFQLGFSSKPERGLLNITSFRGANSMLPISADYAASVPHIHETGETEEIQLVTVDDFVREQAIPYIDLVKIDVEGFEIEVLRGGESTFGQRVSTVLLEIALSRHGYDSDNWIQLLNLMHGYGFDLVGLYDIAYHKTPQHGLRLFQMDAVFCKRGQVLFA